MTMHAIINDKKSDKECLTHCCNTKPMDIDLVYLWVDGNDPQWITKHNAYINTTGEKSTDCKGRYSDNDELKYSLRSIAKYAPWIHRIFIVTDNQTPAWLDTSNPKVKIIDHKEIMPATCLPCFNSTLIEHFLYKIPDLAEHFLYANDDTFINQPVSPSTFFGKNGYPIIRLNRKPFRRLTIFFREKILRKPLKNYVAIIRNAARLVKREYGIYFNGRTHHNIDAYLKSSYEHTGKIFQKELESTFQNHIRSTDDIHRHIYSYVPICEKKAYPVYVTQRTSLRLRINIGRHYKKFERYNPMLFCMNDSEYATDSDREKATSFLKKKFPEKSVFEK